MKKSYYLFTLCIVILINLVNYCQDTRRSFTEPNVVYVGWEIGKYSPDSAGVTDAMLNAAALQEINHQIITVDLATGVYDLGMGQMVLRDSVYVRWGLGLVMSSDNPGGTVVDDSVQVYSSWENDPTLINTDSAELNINLKNAGTIINRPDMAGYLPYKVYTALLTQLGIYPPTAIVIANTIGNVVWSRSQAGLYQLRLTGHFPYTKTVGFITNNNTSSSALRVIFSNINPQNDYIQVVTMSSAGQGVDNVLYNTPIEIRVYP